MSFNIGNIRIVDCSFIKVIGVRSFSVLKHGEKIYKYSFSVIDVDEYNPGSGPIGAYVITNDDSLFYYDNKVYKLETIYDNSTVQIENVPNSTIHCSLFHCIEIDVGEDCKNQFIKKLQKF